MKGITMDREMNKRWRLGFIWYSAMVHFVFLKKKKRNQRGICVSSNGDEIGK
jgi:hypothetical protein